MKNFLRALRYAWPYRYRLVCSVCCALVAAVFWGLNFTSVYPVLKLLHTGKSPHVWIDERIKNTEDEIKRLVGEIDKLRDEQEQVSAEPSTDATEKRKRDIAAELARKETKLEFAQRSLYYFAVTRKFIYAYAPTDCFETLVWVLILVLGGTLIKCLFEFAQESLVGSVVNLALFDLRNRFYRQVIHLDVDQFNDQGSAEMMARFTNDMESLGTGLKTLFGKVVAEPLRALACILVAAYISWQLTLMFLILVPIAAFILVRIGREMKRATRRLLERMSNIYKILQESFQGIKVVKAYTMEPYERRRFAQATKDYYRKSMLVVNIDAVAGPIVEVLGMLTITGAILVGSYLVMQKETHIFGMRMTSYPLEPETMVNLYVLLAAIADPVRKLSSVFTRIQSGRAASDRIFEFLDKSPRVRANSDGPRLTKPALAAPTTTPADRKGIPPLIEFRNVCFSYNPEPLLIDVNFTVRPGEMVAVVGANGSGKTTLLGLLPRFYDPHQGSVLIAGQDIRNVSLRSLRQHVGVVTQEPLLFEDTVFNNIAYGSRHATAEDVEAAARKAHIHDVILKRVGGYGGPVGERGQNFSGGERQRLCLARLILRDPSILVLDEFTSAADPESTVLIHQAMKEFAVGRTSFVITHNLGTLEMADRILVMDRGRVAGFGTHAELLATCPAYQRLQDAHGQRKCA